ncbi:MAG: hypothetical protein HY962_05420 [Ignavibacteriae bacterium]|nr:hypothetical protein [Ignavibacteriota bacterium]
MERDITLHNAFRGVLAILAVAGALVISSPDLCAQYINDQASGTVTINVARLARVDAHNEPLTFGWMTVGMSKEVHAWESRALRFMVTAEGASDIDVTFPLSLVLHRKIGGNLLSGPGNEIPFLREPVKYYIPPTGTEDPVQPGSGGANFVGDGVTTNTMHMPGDPGQSIEPRTFFWVGGSVSAPAGTIPGLFYGRYTVTISNYRM